jgi:hypothetical protein
MAARCLRPARPVVTGGADPRTRGTGGIERIHQFASRAGGRVPPVLFDAAHPVDEVLPPGA